MNMASRILKSSTPFSGLAILCLVLGACSNQQIYEAIQQNRLQACEERPIPERRTCEANYQMDYEEYRREREELIAEEE